MDGSLPPASRCQIANAFEEPRESAYGYKQTSSRPKSKSALPPTSDVELADVLATEVQRVNFPEICEADKRPREFCRTFFWNRDIADDYRAWPMSAFVV